MSGLIQCLDQQVKHFSFVDVKLLQLLGIFLGIVLVKLVPQILEINIWTFVILAVACAVKPCCVFFLGSDGER